MQGCELIGHLLGKPRSEPIRKGIEEGIGDRDSACVIVFDQTRTER
jgi:hypothetical protein